MGSVVSIYQIYYDDYTKTKLDPQFAAYFNPKCSKYFESNVIIDFYHKGAMAGCDYFGLVSWRIWNKVPQIKNLAQMIESDNGIYDFYYVGLDSVGNVWRQAEEYLECDLTSQTELLLRELGYDVCLHELPVLGYYNYQICKTHLYREFVSEFLMPMIALMDDPKRHDLQMWLNEKVNYVQLGKSCSIVGRMIYPVLAVLPYPIRTTSLKILKLIASSLGSNRKPVNQARLQEISGFAHYTKHAFVVERLFPTYAAIKGWKGKRFA